MRNAFPVSQCPPTGPATPGLPAHPDDPTLEASAGGPELDPEGPVETGATDGTYGAYDYDLAVIGSGPAGQKGAIAAAKLGKRVAIIDRHEMVGGVCLHTGTIPSKTVREAILSAQRSA